MTAMIIAFAMVAVAFDSRSISKRSVRYVFYGVTHSSSSVRVVPVNVFKERYG